MIAIRIVVAAVVVTAACKKEAPAKSTRPAPLSATERKRGNEACTAYLAKVCACAQARPAEADLAERCRLDKALSDALELAIGVDDNPEATYADVWRAQDQARKIVANCLQSVNELAGKGCP